MIGDFPVMDSLTRSHATYSAAALSQPLNAFNGIAGQAIPAIPALYKSGGGGGGGMSREDAVVQHLRSQQGVIKMATTARRFVKVIIIDPDTRIDLDKCVLYNGAEKLTDATDQELFFEIEIKSLLDAHNEERKKIVDKAVKDRTEYLEPIKIRDLKMVVTTIASF